MVNPETEVSIADFERYFPHTPAALCVKECARLSVLRRYVCPGPVLDVGCGDGLFASIAFSDVEVWGIDVDAKEGRWAAASQAYSQVVVGDVTQARLPASFFRTCVANCSLEHVVGLPAALTNLRSTLQPSGRIYAFVPNKDWARSLLSVRALDAVGASGLAENLREFIDYFFKHHHLYDKIGWHQIFENAGFTVVAVEPVLSTATTQAFEALLLFSLAGWMNKHLTTRWTNFPLARRTLAWPVYAVIKALLRSGDPSPTAEYLVIAERPESGS